MSLRFVSKALITSLVLLGTGACTNAGEGGDPWRFDASAADDGGDVAISDAVDSSSDSDTDAHDADDVSPDANGVRCPDVRDALSLGDTVRAILPEGTGDVDEASCATSIGREHVYQLTIDRPTDVEITTRWENDETVFSPVLTLLEGCESDTELACSNPLSAKPDGINGLLRVHLEPGHYRLRVDERNLLDFGEGGAYTLRVEETDLADNASCEDATVLEAGEQRSVTPDRRGVYGQQSRCFGILEDVRFFAVDVPPGQNAHALADFSDGEGGPFVRMARSCDDGDCERAFGGNALASLSNTSDVEQRFYVAVSNTRARPYTIEVMLAPLADHAVCSQAQPLVADGEAVDVDFSGSLANHALCNGNLRNTLFYSVGVPDNHRLFTDIDGTSGTRSGVQPRDGCGDTACLGSYWVNDSGQPRSVVLNAYSDSISTASLSAQTVELVDHASCDSARPIGVGETLVDQRIAAGGGVYNPCQLVLGTSSLTLYYQVDVQLGLGPVTVRAQSRDPQNLTVSLQALPMYIEDICSESVARGQCIADDDSYFRATPTAEIQLDGSFGGGRDPATALIAVTMSPANSSGSWLDAAFDLSVTRD